LKKPSGTAITIIVIPIITKPTSLSIIFVVLFALPVIISITKYTINTETVKLAQIIPIVPMSFATPSNFIWRGVGGYSSKSFNFNFPTEVFFP